MDEGGRQDLPSRMVEEPGPSGRCVAKQQKGPGIQSAAGLIRYFDAEEDTAFKIPPMAVIILTIAVGLGAILMTKFWKF